MILEEGRGAALVKWAEMRGAIDEAACAKALKLQKESRLRLVTNFF